MRSAVYGLVASISSATGLTCGSADDPSENPSDDGISKEEINQTAEHAKKVSDDAQKLAEDLKRLEENTKELADDAGAAAKWWKIIS